MSDPKFTIRLAATNIGLVFAEAHYVQRYVPASMDESGRYRDDGALQVTSEHADALFFQTAGEAFEFSMQSNGARPDGQPNRPLRSYTLDISGEPMPLDVATIQQRVKDARA